MRWYTELNDCLHKMYLLYGDFLKYFFYTEKKSERLLFFNPLSPCSTCV